MVSRLKLEIDLSKLKGSPTKASFSAPIWWKLGDYAYPEANWTDFALILVQWWTLQAIELLRGEQSAEFAFMDGNFSLFLFRNGDTLVATDADSSFDLKIDLSDLIRELKKANQYLISELSSLSSFDTETEKLSRGYVMLDSLSKDIL